MQRLAILVLSTALLLGFSATAFADIRADARKYYKTGMALLKSGQVDEGVEALEKAFSLMPHPNTLLTLARVFEQLKDWKRSIHYYQRYLEFDPIDRADVQELINRMQLKLDPSAKSAKAPSDKVSPSETEAATDVQPKAAPPKTSPKIPKISATAVLREIALRLDRLAEVTTSGPLKQDADQLVEIAKAIEKDDPQVPLAPKVDADVLMRQRGCASTEGADSLVLCLVVSGLALWRRERRHSISA